jgi:hypothetical protein
MSITEFQIVDKSSKPSIQERAKGMLAGDIVLFALFILFMGVSFWLGYLAGEGRGGSDVVITEGALPAAIEAGSAASISSKPSLSAAGDGHVVASKNGTRYYYPWCGGVGRIKPENLVSFPSPEAAELAGLTLASGCK